MQQKPAETVVQPKPRMRINLGAFGPLIAFIVLFIVAAIIGREQNFLSAQNITNLLIRMALLGPVAIGMTFVIIGGGLDLSVGSMMALIGGLMIFLSEYLIDVMGYGFFTALLVMIGAVVIGLIFGLINGLLVTKAKIEPFIVTLGTMAIFRSVFAYLAGGGSLRFDTTFMRGARDGSTWAYSTMYSGKVLQFGDFPGIPLPFVVLIVLAILAGILLNKTRFGRYVLAIGSNENVARYSAINVDRIKLYTYCLIGACVGIATILQMGRLGSVQYQTGMMLELQAIAAVVIGGTALKGGSGRISGTLLGVAIFVLIEMVLNMLPWVDNNLVDTFRGAIIIVAVWLQILGNRKR
mgnify:CR=1 FL=1